MKILDIKPRSFIRRIFSSGLDNLDVTIQLDDGKIIEISLSWHGDIVNKTDYKVFTDFIKNKLHTGKQFHETTFDEDAKNLQRLQEEVEKQ